VAREATTATAGRTDNTLRLRDGRRLGYAEYGDPGGRPLFYFHGYPDSRLGARLAHEDAARRGVRVIAFDRPGFGLSDFKRGRTIGDWTADVAEAADELGIERFAVIGISGGGPYAAACAAKIPHRLTSAAIVSGLAPLNVRAATAGMSRWNRLTIPILRRLPWLLPAIARLLMWLFAQGLRRWPDRVLRLLSRSAPASDKAILAKPEIWAAMKEDFAEAFRQGSRGAAWELVLYLRPWDFRLEDISVDVHLWQGETDNVIPASMGRYLAQTIPNCQARFYPDEGHLLVVDRMEEIQSALFP